MFPLVISEILVLFVNTTTADDEQSFPNIENLSAVWFGAA